MLPRLRVDCASKSGAQRRRSECLVPGIWGVDPTKELNPTNWNKTAVHMHDNPTRQNTYSDVGQIIDGGVPDLATNCEKPIVWRECDRANVVRVLDEAKLGVCRRVQKCDGTPCGVCDEFPMLW